MQIVEDGNTADDIVMTWLAEWKKIEIQIFFFLAFFLSFANDERKLQTNKNISAINSER